MASPRQPRPDGRLRRALEAIPVAPIRPWFNRWFTALSDHVAEDGGDTRAAVQEMREELARDAEGRLIALDHTLRRRIDESLVPVPQAITDRVDRIVADLRIEARGVAEVALSTERRLARLEASVADLVSALSPGPPEESLSVERPFVHRALSGLPLGSRVLDVGARGSTIPLELATVGHEVTLLDARASSFPHPSVTVVPDAVDSWPGADAPFDAIVARIVEPGFPLDRLRDWLVSDGQLVLSVRVGAGAVEATHVDKVIAGWAPIEAKYFERAGNATWLGSDTDLAEGYAFFVLTQ